MIQLDEAEAQHAETLAGAEGLRRAVLELHKPVEGFWPDQPVECVGCDPGDYAETGAVWPCSTYVLARDWID